MRSWDDEPRAPTRTGQVPGSLDEIPEPMVIASLRPGPIRHADDHRPFAHPPQLLRTLGVSVGAHYSRRKVQIVRADSWAVGETHEPW
jgi:hypothetical protein